MYKRQVWILIDRRELLKSQVLKQETEAKIGIWHQLDATRTTTTVRWLIKLASAISINGNLGDKPRFNILEASAMLDIRDVWYLIDASTWGGTTGSGNYLAGTNTTFYSFSGSGDTYNTYGGTAQPSITLPPSWDTFNLVGYLR